MSRNQFNFTYLTIINGLSNPALRLVFPAAILLFSYLFPLGLSAQEVSREELEARRNELIKEIKLTTRLLSTTRESRKNTLDGFVALRRQIRAREALLKNLESELTYVQTKLNRTKEVIGALQTDLDRLQEEFARMLQLACRQKATRSPLWFVLSAPDLNQGFRRWQYLQQYERYRQKQSVRIRETMVTLHIQQEELDERKAEQERLIQAQRYQQQLMATELAEKNAILQNLKENETRLASDLREKQTAHQRLTEAIEEIIKAEIARREAEARAKTLKAGASEAIALDSENFANNKGKLPWPVEEGIITTLFGKQPHPTIESVFIVNNGIDLLTRRNAPAKAIFPGTVLADQFVPGHDFMLIIRHGNYYSVYSNLESLTVNRGQSVEVGQTIGVIKADNDNGQSELHFELWQDKTRLDPSEWILSRS
jgi:septal ring factor EnvC (AmiA/AmiB activator)